MATCGSRAAVCAGCLAVAGLLSPGARAEVRLPGVFSDHMVLQRDLRAPVWGDAAPGEKVTVTFRGQSKSVTADKDGKWIVRLDPLTAGGPDTLTVAGSNAIAIEDVLVGEVWLGSGQSNMDIGVKSFTKGDETLAALAAAAPYPRLRLLRSPGAVRWREATAENIPGMSALLFAFGLRLHKELDVPVGIMVGAVSGSPSGPWLTPQMLDDDAPCQDLIKRLTSEQAQEDVRKKHEQALADWEKASKEAEKQGKKAPRKPNPPVTAGDIREKAGRLHESHIRPLVPYGIRGVLWDQGESGTALPGIDQYTLMGALIRGWRKEWAQGDFPFIYVQKPSGGGCAWDPADPVTCKASPFAPPPAAAPKAGDGLNRELHIRILQHPNTAMAISSDLGAGLHPPNKSGYGARAARVALGMAYGRKVEIYGPMYDSYAVEGDKVRIRFKHVGQGLAARHGEKLQGFIVAGEDKVFHWADASIDGDTVVVSSRQVPKPAAVRYAWSENMSWANVFNKDGLPALTFRTDRW
jgi:sialate O-acetylesterase